MSSPLCPQCQAPMVARPSRHGRGRWWGCSRWPACDVTYGEHADGRPMSSPANAAIRALRREAHAWAEAIWDYADPRQRKAMYSWLGRHTRAGHIGMMSDAEELRALIAELKARAQRKLRDHFTAAR